MHSLITSILDLVGMLLLVAALAWWAGSWMLPLGLGVAGAGVLLVSLLIDRPHPRRRGGGQR